jgi:hypothetical protein
MGCCLNKEVSEGWSSWKVKPLATRNHRLKERSSRYRRNIKKSDVPCRLASACQDVGALQLELIYESRQDETDLELVQDIQ